MSEVDAVINNVRIWLGNPLSRRLIRYIYNGSLQSFNKMLEKYAELNVDLSASEKFKYMILERILNIGAKSFGKSKEELKSSLKSPFIRRAIANILGGIAEYGVRRPQTTIAPFLVVWNYTKLCNLKCKHCYENAGLKRDVNELNTIEAKKVVEEFVEAGVVAIAFSGGEPLMRKDFYEVASHAYKKEFYISIATNGTLINRETALKLKDSGVQYVEVSLDGLEETHDNFRGVRGSFKRSMEGIKNCINVGLDVGVATTITKQNINEVPKLVDMLEDIGVKRFIAFNFIPVGRGKDIMKMDLEPEERKKILEEFYGKLIVPNCRIQTYSTAPQYSVVSVNFWGRTTNSHTLHKQISNGNAQGES